MSPPTFEPIRFGRYELVEQLAVGGMAEIFKATIKGAHGFSKTLVVKRILPHLAEDQEFVDMFIDEANLMVRLNHPKIVQVLDFGEVEGQYFMAMEYVEGMDGLAMLRTCAKRRCRPTTGIAIHVMADVLDALDYAHGLSDELGRPLGVVHRDISPSNIFISSMGDIKVGDFGIARAANRRGQTEAGALKGKYGYMAPEQVAGLAVDHRADVFAVGVVLAELLMIRRLFYAKNDLEVLLQVRDAQIERLHKYGQRIPPPVMQILEAALERDPSLRYQTAAAFRDALHRYLFETRRMVRGPDVRRFLEKLIADDEPIAPRKEGERPGRSSMNRDSLPPMDEETGHHDQIVTHASTDVSGDISTDISVTMTPATMNEDEGAMPRLPATTSAYGDDSMVGSRRRIHVAPPLPPSPVPPSILNHPPEELRMRADDALTAAPELVFETHSRGEDFAVSYSEEIDLPIVVDRPPSQDITPVKFDVDRSPKQAAASTGVAPGVAPSFKGTLARQSLFHVMYALAVDEETGLLRINVDNIDKDIFLVNGDPHFVTSNRPDELFGQYLTDQKVITDGELSMALAILPRFNGRLGDALVALKLLRPMEVMRHLTHQVRRKLLEAFCWTSGTYAFYRGCECEQDAAPLGLNAFEVMGSAVKQLPVNLLDKRLAPLWQRALNVVAQPSIPLEVFRMGHFPRQVFERMNGTVSLRAHKDQYTDPEYADLFCRVVYLLLEIGLIA